MDEKVYQYLRSLYVGRSELAANYLTRLKADYQLSDKITTQRLRIVRDSNGFPNGVSFVSALDELADNSVCYDRTG